jgi:hypothetical protein
LLGAIEGFVDHQWIRAAARVGDDVNELGEYLRRQGELIACLMERLQQLACGGVP